MLMAGEVEMQMNLGDWRPVRLQLFENCLQVEGPEATEIVAFEPGTRVTIPMRNLRSESRYKGCAFQVEGSGRAQVFLAPSLQEKNAWARKLNIVLGELRQSGNYNVNDENAPITPVLSDKKAPMAFSVDRQQRQKAAVQQLAQSLQPCRTASRTAPIGGVSIDRSAEIDGLRNAIEHRETVLAEKEQELAEVRQQLQREQQYREQITSGVEKWRQDMTRQKDQKLQDTRERLEEQSQRVKTLEKDKSEEAEARQRAEQRVEELEAQVRELEEEVDHQHGLKADIAALRDRLAKEVAFVQVLEHDTQQMAEELTRLAAQHHELREKHEADTDSYRNQCDELRAQLQAKEDETLQLKQEVGQLQLDNKRLQEAQNRMHREFFFSLALSIKLSLAQQGIYSNADLNMLYELVLAEPYSAWTQVIEKKLVELQMPVDPQMQHHHYHQPQGRGGAAAPPVTPNKKKGGLFGLFN